MLYALPSSFAPVLISTGGLTVRNDSQPALLLQRAMLRANKLAIRGLGLTTPNPIVGAVILDAEGKEVASGFHRGGDHAEVIAINGALAQGFSDFANSTSQIAPKYSTPRILQQLPRSAIFPLLF